MMMLVFVKGFECGLNFSEKMYNESTMNGWIEMLRVDLYMDRNKEKMDGRNG